MEIVIKCSIQNKGEVQKDWLAVGALLTTQDIYVQVCELPLEKKHFYATPLSSSFTPLNYRWENALLCIWKLHKGE